MLAAAERDELERTVRSLCDAGDYDDATTAALQGYGSELMGFFVAAAQNEGLADDAFALFCEHLWKGLPKFQWRSSLRTWVYVVGRNALRMTRRGAGRRREVTLSSSDADRLVAEIRSQTRTFLRTETKDAVAKLRQQLDPEDQELLLLRLSRQMSWVDIARVMHDDGELTDDELKRNAARLRQRFSRAKTRLQQLVDEHGLRGT